MPDEKQRSENPLLPYTRSEIALPLIAGDRVLGALNVQSTKIADFGVEVIETMQNMAGQVAVALENARLFQETQLRINEMRAIQQQDLIDGWGFLSMRKNELEYSIGEVNEANTQIFTSSINLRDQIIGHIAVESTADWTTEQKNLIDAVATQAAIALENARLVNESRQIATHYKMLLFAIPNGGHRNIITATMMQREGVLSGVADLFLSIPRGEFHGFYISSRSDSHRHDACIYSGDQGHLGQEDDNEG